MKKNRIGITFLLIFLCLYLSCSVAYKYKYGVINITYPMKSRKNQLIAYLDYLKDEHQEYKNGKIPLITAYPYSIAQSYCEHPLLPDSIIDMYKVVDITEKQTDNYQIINNKIVPVSVFIIDIQSVNHKESSNISIVSIDTSITDFSKIQKGNVYKFLLFSYFDRDKTRPIDNNDTIIYIGRNDTKYLLDILILNTWIKGLDITGNLYTTPNLKGLYYVPN